MIKALLWDVDGTLIDFKAGEKAAISACFKIFGLGDCPDAYIEEYSEINSRYWRLLEQKKMTKQQILEERFREFFSLHGIDPDTAPAFNKEYQVRLGDTVVFTDGAYETVKRLRGRVLQLGVTNGTFVAQDRKLHKSGLYKLLDKVFISEKVGFEKPDPRFFDAVLSSLPGVSRREIMIVGDSQTSDMEGGRRSGILTCFYNPLSLPFSEKVDFEISRIPEVEALL